MKSKIALAVAWIIIFFSSLHYINSRENYLNSSEYIEDKQELAKREKELAILEKESARLKKELELARFKHPVLYYEALRQVEIEKLEEELAE
ncbi:hypothetical protein P0Y35_11695 [Kiritimatiellaeota bacterium B1221]|nr:hypothetical protein [Kiritimatiellaeota bacterium B1221]